MAGEKTQKGKITINVDGKKISHQKMVGCAKHISFSGFAKKGNHISA